MNGLAQAERDFDRRLPSDYDRKESREYDAERDFRPRHASITDVDVEKFIAALAGAKDKDLFLEEEVGTLPGADNALHIAVANQWAKNMAQIGEVIGPVFWRWAKACTITAARR